MCYTISRRRRVRVKPKCEVPGQGSRVKMKKEKVLASLKYEKSERVISVK